MVMLILHQKYFMHQSELILDIIRNFGELDIQQDSVTFAVWQQRKMAERDEPVKTIPLVGKINAKDLANLSDAEINMLIKKLQKSSIAYKAWAEDKETQHLKKKILKLDLQEKERVELDRAALRKLERDVYMNQQIEKWQKVKDDLKKEQAGKKELQVLRDKLDRERRKQQSEEAFEIWRAKNVSREPKLQMLLPVPKRDIWIQNLIPQSNLIQKRGSKMEVILSPPALYNDYSVYKKYAPDFFRKYSLLVASGGMQKDEEPRPLKSLTNGLKKLPFRSASNKPL